MNKAQAQIIINKMYDSVDPNMCVSELAEAMCAHFGIEIDDSIQYEYENSKMVNEKPEVMIHNINHFQIAPAKRKLMPDFGLGSAFNTSMEEAALVVSTKVAEQEEELVSTLDFVYASHFGYELKIIYIDNVKHKNIIELYKRGLIDINGRPTFNK